MNPIYTIKTQRLGLRKWQESDLEPLFAMNQDEQVMRYFPNILSQIDTEQMFNRLNLHFEEYGYGLFAVDKLEAQEFIGFIGLTHPRFEAFFTPCVEIGWRLKSSEWNKGYATEGALACLEYGFNVLKLPKIYSFTSVLNTLSENVMKKIGMKKIGEFDHPNLEKGHRLSSHVIYVRDEL
jgi:[ribosomal protein S5]-alanine N-acetyltransferase